MAPETINNFDLLEEIGRGRATSTRRAVYRPTSKVVAIKVFPPEVLAKKSGRALWDSEMKFHCPLQHENVLQCYDFFIEDDHGYLVMEYVEGFNLRKCIKSPSACVVDRGERFSHLVNTAEKISCGLQYLHDQKIIHGHIKPENVLVSKEVGGVPRVHKQVKISDFALAGRLKGIFHPSSHVRGGTLNYMSPEQIEKKTATIQSDIFCLGITFYELFTGRSPWGKPSGKKQLLSRVLSPKYRPPAPSQLVESLPRRLDTLIMKMLEKDERDRHSTVAEVWTSLQLLDTRKI